MNNNWSLTDKMYLYLSFDGERVSIANPESKKFWGPVQKISESVNPPLVIDNNGSDIKILDGKVYLSVSGKYLKINNLFEEDFLDQISGATINGGEASGVIFGFSEINPEKTILIFPGTNLHKTSSDSFYRKINLSLQKKTTNYIPGHRYESESGSFWYLGEYLSHRDDTMYSSGSYDISNKKAKVKVFSNFLPDSKKVSDIFVNSNFVFTRDLKNNGSSFFPKTVISTFKNISMADMGEELDLDVSIEDSYLPRIQEFMKSHKTEYTTESGKYYYPEILKLFSIFDITNNTLFPGKITDEIKSLVKEIILSNLNYIFFLYYSDKTDPSKENTFISRFKNKFLNKSNYYYNSDYIMSMLNLVFGINIKKEADLILSSYSKPEINSFKDYVENIGSLEFNEPDTFNKRIDFLYVKEGNKDITKYLPDCPYRDLIVDIYKKAIDSNGSNLEYFNIENVGTSRTPLLKYVFDISLKDILKYYGVDSLYKLPDPIKKDLTNLKIYKVTFITRSDINPKLHE